MTPNHQVQYVLPDGRLTLQGMQLLQQQARRIAELEAQAATNAAAITAANALIGTNTADIAALDVRVTALEP